jgi:hypothetical protein
MQPRIYVLSGQFGRLISAGMLSLIPRLKPYGEVSFHGFRDNSVIEGVLRSPKEQKIIIIGYSLGANQLGWISKWTFGEREIDLGVAYDPSRQSPLVHRSATGRAVQLAPNFKRLVVYYNPSAWWLGGSTYDGSNVEEIVIREPHALVQLDQSLHRRTVEYVRQTVEAS